jgi:SRSO17 transposase
MLGACMQDARMRVGMDEGLLQRVGEYFARIGEHLPEVGQRGSFATYAFGILGEGDRKSVEPMAARASPEPVAAGRTHDRLLHFIRESPWDDRLVRREAAKYAIEHLSARQPVTTWILDDTGFLKQGRDSPGVQRQYTGSAGKIANCQIGVSLTVATRTEQVPIDFELYVPQVWIDDPLRRKKARIPETLGFKTKIDLALDLITRAVEDKVPGDTVLTDSAYGRSSAFRDTVRMFGLDYAVAVDAATRVWVLDSLGRRRGDAVAVADLGAQLGTKAFRRLTWRQGTADVTGGKGRKLTSRFLFRRVKPAHEDWSEPAQREPLWLVAEWPPNEPKPTKFFFTTLPRRLSKKKIVRTLKERWKTERAYQELKGELGLDHYEGRSFTGWHHHVSVVLCCYAFVVAERVRAFPPSQGRSRQAEAVARAA